MLPSAKLSTKPREKQSRIPAARNLSREVASEMPTIHL